MLVSGCYARDAYERPFAQLEHALAFPSFELPFGRNGNDLQHFVAGLMCAPVAKETVSMLPHVLPASRLCGSLWNAVPKACAWGHSALCCSHVALVYEFGPSHVAEV